MDLEFKKTTKVVIWFNSLAFAIYAVVINLWGKFQPTLGIPDALLIVLEILGSALLYTVIYQAIAKCYEFLFFKCKRGKYHGLAIEGDWYLVHLPEEKCLVEAVRAGECYVKRKTFDLRFTATNVNYTVEEKIENGIAVKKVVNKNGRKTNWSYLFSDYDIEDSKIYGCYETKSKGKKKGNFEKCPVCGVPHDTADPITIADPMRMGVHSFNLIHDKNGECVRLEGLYADCFPSISSGEVRMFRLKSERDFAIMEFFKGITADKLSKAKKELAAITDPESYSNKSKEIEVLKEDITQFDLALENLRNSVAAEREAANAKKRVFKCKTKKNGNPAPAEAPTELELAELALSDAQNALDDLKRRLKSAQVTCDEAQAAVTNAEKKASELK